MSTLERAALQLSAEIDRLAAKLSEQKAVTGTGFDTGADTGIEPALRDQAQKAIQAAKSSSGDLNAVLTDLKALQAKLGTADQRFSVRD